jgi:hypothetical protein
MAILKPSSAVEDQSPGQRPRCRRPWETTSLALALCVAVISVYSLSASSMIQHVKVAPSGTKAMQSVILENGKLIHRSVMAPGGWGSLPAGWHWRSDKDHWQAGQIPDDRSAMGFEWASESYDVAPNFQRLDVRRCSVPLWLVALLFCIVPVRGGFRRRVSA